MKVIYTALFVKDPTDLLKKFPPKHARVFAHHSTIAFKPKSIKGVEMGRESKIKILGRVFDEKGDALLVENPKSENAHPHITLSCAEGTVPNYSNELIEKGLQNQSVEYFPVPEEIIVVEGYFDGVTEVV